MTTSRSGLDPDLQNPSRLAVTAFLSGCGEAEFKAVRDGLQMSDPTLSKTITALESAGLVNVRKGFVGRRPRTWVSLTCDGRTRLADHLASLQALAERAREFGAATAQ